MNEFVYRGAWRLNHASQQPKQYIVNIFFPFYSSATESARCARQFSYSFQIFISRFELIVNGIVYSRTKKKKNSSLFTPRMRFICFCLLYYFKLEIHMRLYGFICRHCAHRNGMYMKNRRRSKETKNKVFSSVFLYTNEFVNINCFFSTFHTFQVFFFCSSLFVFTTLFSVYIPTHSI